MSAPYSRLLAALERGRFLAALALFDAVGAIVETARSGALRRIALALVIGAAGAFLAHWLHVPLAFMMGALFATMAASLAGLPIEAPNRLRSLFLVVIGWFLGEGFTGEAATAAAGWWPSLILALLYPIVASALCYAFYLRAARMGRADALFCAIPGGLTGVVLLSGQYGADEGRVALSHSARIALIVLLAPTVFFGLLGYEEPTLSVAEEHLISWPDAALLAVVSALAIGAARRLGVPMAQMLAPLFAGVALRLGGWVEGALPAELVEGSLIVIGAGIGARFVGARLGALVLLAVWTAAGTAIMLLLSALFAFAAAWTTGGDVLPAFLAFAPGGVTEMSLISIAMGTDPAYVAAHHFARLFFILLATPFIAPKLMRWIGAAAPSWPRDETQSAQSEAR